MGFDQTKKEGDSTVDCSEVTIKTVTEAIPLLSFERCDLEADLPLV